MKGHYHHHQQQHPSPPLLPPKRRCSGLAAAVPALVVCSVLLPLAFLLGLHRPGFGSEERAAVVITTELDFGARKHLDGGTMKHKLLKDVSKKKTYGSGGISGQESSSSKSRNPSVKSKTKLKDEETMDITDNGEDDHDQETVNEENPKPCELEYGSYCLWSTEHKEAMKDAAVKRLKDQLFIARAHYPSIAKLNQQESFTRELKQNIQEHERMLSDTIADADLPPFFAEKLEKMEHIIERAKSCGIGCSTVERKLRQLLDITEDEGYFHTRQSARLYHLAVQTMPKTHHCLNMRLTVEYFESRSIQTDQLNKQKHERPSFHNNYVIFSRNVLAASTTINSTVVNSKDSGSLAFHLFTDAQNFYAMKHWFDRNSYLDAAVHVTNIEDHQEPSRDVNPLDTQKLRPAEEFRVTIRDRSEPLPGRMKTEYISVFGRSHSLLPDLLPSLNRVVVLDDDLIVQKDLSSLWDLDMGGKVIGAVQFCGVRLGQLRAYIAEHSFNASSCVWLSGLNVVELEKWRQLRVTGPHEQLHQQLQKDFLPSQKPEPLPSILVAFHDLIYPLEDSWVQSGLGHDHGISRVDIENAAALHYDGAMKPWLDLGIHGYKSYWRRYTTHGERSMTQCNVHW